MIGSRHAHGLSVDAKRLAELLNRGGLNHLGIDQISGHPIVHGAVHDCALDKMCRAK
ncbi:hypothetical protein PAMC26577_39270 [Caballeronia sordidicola]|uniref:Uncharacterized protein n=1 Tax=Caballeronia sordidicola TaxID=196367 RepID=A0A242M345_CABSO|nr:hypothetical protein PAMC26577_39270 [Caballeronia sordidicola]